MAIIYPGIRCSLCNEEITDAERANDEYVATSHFLGPFHPLHRYSDSAMHKTCFLNWEHRAAWVRVYNEIVGSRVASNGTSHYMDDEGEIVRVPAT